MIGQRDEASKRAEHAWNERYKHGRAARIWDAVVTEEPQRAEVARILGQWMAAYEAADAEAERAFRDLAAGGTP